MKKGKNILLYFSIIWLGVTACTEVYEPEVESSENIICIEGGITNGTQSCQIILQYARDYGSADKAVNVSGAEVLLYEDERLVDQFYETSKGVYLTQSDGFNRLPGKYYKLVINAPDGNVYESEPQQMPELPEQLDAVYGYEEIIKIKYYNVYGDFIVKEEKVLQLYADLPVNSQNTYSRFECRSILEFFTDIIAYPGTSSSFTIPLYLWESYNSDDLNILEINSSLSGIKKFPVSHLINNKEKYAELSDYHADAIQAAYDLVPIGAVPDTIYSDTGYVVVDSIIYGIPVSVHESTYYTGWILHITQFSITKPAYIYWTDIKKLEESSGELFDPINTQLRGNMVCINDPNKIMIGFFEVASTTITPAFINFDPTEGNYLSKKLEAIDKISSRGWNDTIPPNFWVYKIFDF